MLKKTLVCLFALGIFAACSAAQAQLDEIIVTARKYEDAPIPAVYLKQRADYMIFKSHVESDSRDPKLRKQEVVTTLETVISLAEKQQGIELGLSRVMKLESDNIEYVIPFTRDALKNLELTAGKRPDTSRTTIIVKTPISESDTAIASEMRIWNFIESVTGAGRALMSSHGRPGLSVVDFRKYRAPFLKALAADNQKTQKLFGVGYTSTISGLEEDLVWQVIGPLELAIYLPYKSKLVQR